MKHIKKVQIEFCDLNGLVDRAKKPINNRVQPVLINKGNDSSNDDDSRLFKPKFTEFPT